MLGRGSSNYEIVGRRGRFGPLDYVGAGFIIEKFGTGWMLGLFRVCVIEAWSLRGSRMEWASSSFDIIFEDLLSDNSHRSWLEIAREKYTSITSSALHMHRYHIHHGPF